MNEDAPEKELLFQDNFHAKLIECVPHSECREEVMKAIKFGVRIPGIIKHTQQ